MSIEDPIVIVGAGVAGVECAFALRDYGFAGRIVLVNGESEHPYDRPAVSKELLEGTAKIGDVLLRPVDSYDDRNIEVVQARAQNVLSANNEVRLSSGGVLSYSRLVLACGGAGRPLVESAPRSPRIHGLRSASDVEAIRSQVAPGVHVAIAGGGLIGCEAATSLRRSGARVTVLERSDRLLAEQWAGVMSGLVEHWMVQSGVEVRTSVTATTVRESSRHIRVDLAGFGAVEADLLICCVGTNFPVEWLRGCGVSASVLRGVECDNRGETTVPGVFVAGDLASGPEFANVARRTELHWEGAAASGRAVAAALMGADVPTLPVPTYSTRIFGHSIQFIGRAVGAPTAAAVGTTAYWVDAHGTAVGALAIDDPRGFRTARRTVREGSGADSINNEHQ